MFDGSLVPGRYWLAGSVSLRAVRAEIAAAGWYSGVISGRAVTGRSELFAQFAAGLRFPGWFGHNWDAFADCLRDLSWLPGAGVAVLWQHYAMFARSRPELAERAGAILDEAIEARVEMDLPPLYVIYPGSRDGASGPGAWRLRPAD